MALQQPLVKAAPLARSPAGSATPPVVDVSVRVFGWLVLLAPSALEAGGDLECSDISAPYAGRPGRAGLSRDDR